MNQKERMLAGLPYKSWLDGLTEDRVSCKQKVFNYNRIPPNKKKKAIKLLKKILGKTSGFINIEPPFYCDYGWNIEIGDNFFANHNFVVLDVGKITIGDNVQCGPNVSIYSAGHPLHPQSRNSGYEYGLPVTIGNNVWIGGSCVILPGITIGDNVVIGAGSIVTKDIPANSIAIGNPCKVIREITDNDRKYYCKNKEFDVTDY